MKTTSKNPALADVSENTEGTDGRLGNVCLDNNRRGFLTKSAIIAPLAMVSLSKPAWGDMTGTAFRCGISGLISGDVASGPERKECTGGFSPGYWKQPHYCDWQNEHNIRFNDFIAALTGSTSGNYYCGLDYKNARLGEILAPNKPDKSGCDVIPNRDDFKNGYFEGSFGWHLIATYLNATRVPTYLFKLDDLKFIINGLGAGGGGSVMLGTMSYSCHQIKALFDSTY